MHCLSPSFSPQESLEPKHIMPRNQTWTTIRSWLHLGHGAADAEDEHLRPAELPTLSPAAEMALHSIADFRELATAFCSLLEPTLGAIERAMHDHAGMGELLIEATRLKNAARSVGAQRLEATCNAVEVHLVLRAAPSIRLDKELRELVQLEITECIRVHRRIRALLELQPDEHRRSRDVAR